MPEHGGTLSRSTVARIVRLRVVYGLTVPQIAARFALPSTVVARVVAAELGDDGARVDGVRAAGLVKPADAGTAGWRLVPCARPACRRLALVRPSAEALYCSIECGDLDTRASRRFVVADDAATRIDGSN